MQSTQYFQEIEQLLRNNYRTTLSVLFPTDNGVREVVIDCVEPGKTDQEIIVHLRDHCGLFKGNHIEVGSLIEAFAQTAEQVGSAKPLLESVAVLTENTEPKLYLLVRKAWAQTFGLADDKSEFTTNPAEVEACREKVVRENLLQQLRRGAEGVQVWNESPLTHKLLCKVELDKASFAGLEIDGIELKLYDLERANFEGAKMSNAKISGCKMSKANFRCAVLNGTEFVTIQGTNADFTDANLIRSHFADTNLRGANFKGARMAGCYFGKANLRGADFTDADMSDVRMNDVEIDGKTTFPSSFSNYYGINWKGQGKNPYVGTAAFDAALGVQDIDDLIFFLKRFIDPSKVVKAIQMLKTNRFQLFSEFDDRGISGIVKSQTDLELFYSCTLNEDGTYSCCTQNLNTCGGLRGSLCKHLLVLIVGLVKADLLTPLRTAKWCAATTAYKAGKVDKEAMTSLFLKYAGATNGDLDWRPTETVPEDYYAF